MSKFFLYCLVLLSNVMILGSWEDYRTQNIYVNSIPKCGTHLLTRCVELLTERPLVELPRNLVASDELPKRKGNEFFATHVRYSKEAAAVFNKNNYKTFLIIRDPRDKIVSRVFWLYDGGWEGQSANNKLRTLSFDELLSRFIRSVKREYNEFLPWVKEKHCCVVKFENLVGPQGGGTYRAQVKEIRKIAKHIGVPITNKILDHCIKNLFGNTVTFRSGKLGSWKKHFKKHHKQLCKKFNGNLLIDLGYERNMKW